METVTLAMAEEAFFFFSTNMIPEWGRWLTPHGRADEQMMEANMIFAVRPSNIHPLPKVIFVTRGHACCSCSST